MGSMQLIEGINHQDLRALYVTPLYLLKGALICQPNCTSRLTVSFVMQERKECHSNVIMASPSGEGWEMHTGNIFTLQQNVLLRGAKVSTRVPRNFCQIREART